ncbi:ATP-grasp domain-containing protein [Alkalihalophilus marmarensis]|uniref:ATP-grasp domain-containing protein n=1 Tax=Alkalihalophilus marmarensis TaxID=521377 RepID=UPI002DBC84BD|nr:ATP-grasp domain-containing protein [Alkalihalophilus marmarensis]MEC2074263.1 ATP-grasp domain-containing protein [Alkalihalophilus marmarensis]
MDKPKILTKANKKAWIYNISDEQNLNRKILPTISDVETNHLIQFQEQQMLFFADKGDVVILKENIEKYYLNYLENWINEIQIIFQQGDFSTDNLNLIPFIKCGNDLNSSTYSSFEEDLVLKFNDKLFTRSFLEEYQFKVTPGEICTTIKEVVDNFYRLTRSSSKVVLKSSYGSSGKGIKVINSELEFKKYMKLLERKNKDNINLIIEKWLENSNTINCSMKITEEKVDLINITQQVVDSNGKYIGTNFTPRFDKDLLKKYKEEMQRLGILLQKNGYKGVLGVDSLIHGGDLYPVIEINARYTQVIYLSNLVELLKYNYGSKYIITTQKTIRLLNDLDFQSLENYLNQLLNPTEKNNYIIYTFGNYKAEKHTTYRFYILFYGEVKSKVDEMVNIFNTHTFKIGE